MRPEEDAAQRAKEKEKERQIIINSAHRLYENKDFQIVTQFLIELFGLKKPIFLPKKDGGFDTHWAAIRDGQRQVFQQLEHLRDLPCKGDANVEPKPTVKR